jgi:hypothetical protein
MSPLIIIGLFVGLPLVLGLLLRIHTSAFFLSIAGGFLLATYVGDTAALVSRSFVASSETGQVAQLVLFFLPMVITMWLMRGSLGPAQLVMHFFPLIGCALLVAVLGIGFLSEATQASVYSVYPGTLIKQMPDAFVGIAVSLQLFLMWMTARPHRNPPPHHRGHHKQ